MARRGSADDREATIDFEAIVASQCKNLEALVQANELTVNGAHAVARRQVEAGRQILDEVSTVVGDLVRPSGSVEDRLARQAESSRRAFEKGVSAAREIGEVIAKTGSEALNVIGNRVIEGFDEMRDYTHVG
jgi:phasin family protein